MLAETQKIAFTYARAVQLASFCSLDHRTLFTALGIIHAIEINAPNRFNSKSVIVATATPAETTNRAKICGICKDFVRNS